MDKTNMKKTEEMSKSLKGIAAALDVTFEELFNTKVGFTLLMWDYDSKEKVVNYISNADRDSMIQALENLLERWKAGEPMPPAHTIK